MIRLLLAAHTTTHKCTSQTFLPDLFDGLRNPATCNIEIGSFNKLGLLATNIVTILLTVAGLVAVGLIILAGFYYLTSSGDASSVKKAKDTLVNALLGLGIILVSFGVVNFIAGQFK